MVVSIRYSTIKKKEATRIEYPAIRAISVVSIVVYLQREQRVFFSFLSSTMISTLYRVQHTYINLFAMISTLYRGKNTRIIKIIPFQSLYSLHCHICHNEA
jgi:hypothetical protein